jgi:hypothetical protein
LICGLAISKQVNFGFECYNDLLICGLAMSKQVKFGLECYDDLLIYGLAISKQSLGDSCEYNLKKIIGPNLIMRIFLVGYVNLTC